MRIEVVHEVFRSLEGYAGSLLEVKVSFSYGHILSHFFSLLFIRQSVR